MTRVRRSGGAMVAAVSGRAGTPGMSGAGLLREAAP